jgi:hypothetical protein
MRRGGLILLAAAAALLGLPAAGASAATVDVMVVGKSRTLAEPAAERAKAVRVRVGGRRCAVGADTPLSALLATRARVGLRDYGACGRSARDAGGLFVRQVGADRNRGRDGWVYKVGRRAGTAPAADLSGPFGRGRLRAGQSVLWFWCVLGRGESCQRTLEAVPASTRVAPGAPLRVTVRGYDDNGRGVPAAGATVALGAASAVTGPDGVATVPAPAAAGAVQLSAAREGMIRSFPRRVTVG